jgi:hypothetical protein
LLGSGGERGHVRAFDGPLNPSRPRRAAVEPEPVNQTKRRIGGGADEGGGRFAERAVERVGVQLQARDHLPAVASAGAEARRFSLDHDDARPVLSQRQRRRQPGVARA